MQCTMLVESGCFDTAVLLQSIKKSISPGFIFIMTKQNDQWMLLPHPQFPPCLLSLTLSARNNARVRMTFRDAKFMMMKTNLAVVAYFLES